MLKETKPSCSLRLVDNVDTRTTASATSIPAFNSLSKVAGLKFERQRCNYEDTDNADLKLCREKHDYTSFNNKIRLVGPNFDSGVLDVNKLHNLNYKNNDWCVSNYCGSTVWWCGDCTTCHTCNFIADGLAHIYDTFCTSKNHPVFFDDFEQCQTLLFQ